MRLPIRTRLTLSFAALLVAMLAVSGGLLLFGFRAWLDQGVRDQIQGLSEEFAEDIAKGEGAILEDLWSLRAAGVLRANSGPRWPCPGNFARDSGANCRRENNRSAEGPPCTSRYASRSERTARSCRRSSTLCRRRRAQSPLSAPPLHEADRVLGVLGVFLAAAAGLLLLAVSALAWFLSGAALKPVERMRRDVSLISATDLERRLAVPATGDEIASLAETLNRMLSRLAEAFERERRFVDDASHELRTPLAILKTELQLALRRSRSREELEAALASAADESERLNRLAENLLVLARLNRGHTPLQRTNADLSALVERSASRFRSKAERVGDRAVGRNAGRRSRLGRRIETGAGAHQSHRQRIDAYAATRAQSASQRRETPTTSSYSQSATRALDFQPAFLDKAFEPFARASEARAGGDRGAGLGLAIVRGIARAHGGTAFAENLAKGGARVTLQAPRSGGS